jgi:phenylacetate-CoA ligase
MYVGLPSPIRRWIIPALAWLPANLKYGGTYRRLRREIAVSESSPEFVLEYQERMFRRMLERAASDSPYYRSVMRERGIQAIGSVGRALDWLPDFPVLKKDVLREGARELLTVPLKSVDEISTSGSSGRPLTFFLDKDRSVKEWAFIHHLWAKAGYRASEKRAVLRGTHISGADHQPWEYDAALRELRLSPFHMTADNLSRFLVQMRRREIHYLHGYPSALTLLATHAASASWDWREEIKGIFPISESLYSTQRQELRRAFPAALILPFYGLSEKVAIAGQVCGADDVYEFEPLYGITELLDEQNQPIREIGQRGRLVATGLLHLAMPLIRYDTEDDAELVREARQDNGYRLRVSGLRSRWRQEFIVGRNGEQISVAAINIHSAVYGSIREFQFFQDQPGIVEVRVVPRMGASRADLDAFVAEIQAKVGASTVFVLKILDAISRNSRGKWTFIEQRLGSEKRMHPGDGFLPLSSDAKQS